MAVYNGAVFLDEAVRSILKQSYKDFEFLIIDDASRDETWQLLQAYHDPRIRLVQNERNVGLAETLNRGLDMIDTEFVARMDADDISMRNRLEWQVAFMDEHPECGMSGTWLRTFELRGQRGISRYPEQPDDIKISQLFCSPVAHATLIMRKAMMDRYQLRYDPGFSRTEDFDLCTRATACFEIRNLQRIAYHYRRHLQCITISNEREMQSQVRKIVVRQLKDLCITPTDMELDLHCRNCLGRGAKSLEELSDAEEWYHKLYLHLKRNSQYESMAIDRVLGRQWFLFCRNSACLGPSAWRALIRGVGTRKGIASPTEKFLFQSAMYYLSIRSAYEGETSPKLTSSSSHPLVSVVMPMRNAERFLTDSVGSILKQSYRNFEFIIVDDESSDESSNIMKSFNDRRIRLLRNERQMGVAESLNRGLAEAKGKYIARMDADDISLSERLSRQVAYLEKNMNLAAVGTRVQYFGGPWGALDLRPCAYSVCGAFLIFGTPIVHPSVMIRKSLLDKSGLFYRSDFSRSEDYDLWARLARFGGLANLSEVLLKYRLHVQSVTSRHQEVMAVQQRSIMNRVLKDRTIELTDADLDLLCGISSCKRSESLSTLTTAASLLKKIISIEPEAPVAMQRAASIAWLRYSANNGHFGLSGWRVFHAADLHTDVPAAKIYRKRLMASCIWHELLGSKKAA